MSYDREILRHDLKAKSQIARFNMLRSSEFAPVQMNLGPVTIPDDAICQECGREFRDHDWQGGCSDLATCDHAVTEPQANLFGGTDEVCVTCGART